MGKGFPEKLQPALGREGWLLDGAVQGWPRRGRKEASRRASRTVMMGVGIRLEEAGEQEAEQPSCLPPSRPGPGASELPLPGELSARPAWLASLLWNGDAEEEAFRVMGPAETGKCGRILWSPPLSARPDRFLGITTHTDPTSTCRHRTFLKRMALTCHHKIALRRVRFGKSQPPRDALGF